MPNRFYHYPNCQTCKKAKRWLDDHDIAYEAIHLVDKTPSKATLRNLLQRSGLTVRKFFNTSGKSYRAGGFSERLNTMSDADALEALAGDGMLIKRPLLDTGERVLVGFREDTYREALG